MKLNSEYYPASYEMETNPVYLCVQGYLVGLFAEHPNPPDKYRIHTMQLIPSFRKQDRVFFESLYSPTRKLSSAPTNLFTSYPCLRQVKFGENEFDLCCFALDAEGDLRNYRDIAVVAPVGQGKSTLLRYVFKYLRVHNPALLSTLYPIEMDCNSHVNRLTSFAKDPAGLERFVKEEILFPQIRRVLQGFAKPNDEAFWGWYAQATGDDYALRSIYCENDREIRDLRRRELDSPHFLKALLRYAVEKRKKKIVVYIDNADPLGIQVQLALIWLAKNLVNEYPLKVVTALRDITYYALLHEAKDAIPKRPISWKGGAHSTIIHQRIEAFMANLPTAYSRNMLEWDGKRIQFRTIEPLMRAILDHVYSPEVSNLVTKLSCGNLRQLLDLLKLLLRSGHLTESALLGPVREALLWKGEAEDQPEKRPETGAPRIPAHIAIAAIFTNNHMTCFSSKVRDLPGVINLWDCSGVKTPWRYFVRNMILHHLFSHSGASGESAAGLLEHATETFGSCPQAGDIIECFEKSLFRMTEKGLVESPDFYRPADLQELRAASNIRLSELGIYYKDKLGISPYYLFFIKDEIGLPDAIERNGKRVFLDTNLCESCIVIHEKCATRVKAGARGINTEKQSLLNLQSTAAAFSYLSKVEVGMLEALNREGQLVRYQRLFMGEVANGFCEKVLSAILATPDARAPGNRMITGYIERAQQESAKGAQDAMQ